MPHFSQKAAVFSDWDASLQVLMDSPETAKQLLLVLLQHFIERRPLPPRAPVFVPPPTAQNRGVLRLVRSAAGE